jgi:hypothetical protein
VRSRRVDDEPTYFVDRCLGRHAVADALRREGARVEIHDDHFPQDCDDDVWIVAVAAQDWAILTKDRRIRGRSGHLEALKREHAAAFVLTSGDRTGAQNAETLVAARHRIARLWTTHTRPLIATVAASGAVTVLLGQRRGGVRR